MFVNRAAHYLKGIGGHCMSPIQFKTAKIIDLEEKFCRNVSRIYGKEFEYLEDFARNEECMTSLFAGGKCNPFTGRFFPDGLPQSIMEDYLNIAGLKGIRDTNAMRSKFKGKFSDMLEGRQFSAVGERSQNFYLELDGLDMGGLKKFFSKFKLKTNRTNFADTIAHEPNEYLIRAEQISQKTKQIPVKILVPNTNRSSEIDKMREFYLNQEAEAAIKAAKEEARVAQLDNSQFTFNAKFTRMKLKSMDIQKYPNPQTVAQIKQLRGSTTEILEGCKNIFAKEMGYDPELIKINFQPSLYPMAFNYASGEIIVASQIKWSKNLLATALRHEMDHMDYYASLCKSIGIEEYKKLLLQKYPEMPVNMFNNEFWEKAIKSAKTLGRKETKLYAESLVNYTTPGFDVRALYESILYGANKAEGRAHDVEATLAKSLNNLSNHGESQGILQSKLSRKIVDMLEKLKQKNKGLDERKLVQDIAEREMLKHQGKYDVNKILNTVLTELENMYY